MVSPHLDLEFHARRAQAELDLARQATSAAAANAHLGLSRLHSERLRAGQGAASMNAARV
ncbi:MAG TPA: hypothetical protein VF662_00425 [Allosphingosinicella sp.]|jgi:hypothetical protein